MTPGPWEVRDQLPIDGVSFGKLGLKSVVRIVNGTVHVLAEMCLPDDAEMMASAPDMRKEIDRLRAVEVRFKAMLPLFEEARDALPAITETVRMLRGISPSLADRMDDVGIPDRWRAAHPTTENTEAKP